MVNDQFICAGCNKPIFGKVFSRGSKDYGKCCIDDVTPPRKPSCGKYSGGGNTHRTKASAHALHKWFGIGEDENPGRKDRLTRLWLSITDEEYHDDLKRKASKLDCSDLLQIILALRYSMPVA